MKTKTEKQSEYVIIYVCEVHKYLVFLAKPIDAKTKILYTCASISCYQKAAFFGVASLRVEKRR